MSEVVERWLSICREEGAEGLRERIRRRKKRRAALHEELEGLADPDALVAEAASLSQHVAALSSRRDQLTADLAQQREAKQQEQVEAAQAAVARCEAHLDAARARVDAEVVRAAEVLLGMSLHRSPARLEAQLREADAGARATAWIASQLARAGAALDAMPDDAEQAARLAEAVAQQQERVAALTDRVRVEHAVEPPALDAITGADAQAARLLREQLALTLLPSACVEASWAQPIDVFEEVRSALV